MTHQAAPARETAVSVAATLMDVASADAEYRDFYLRRARDVLAPIMSREALETARRERAYTSARHEEVKQAVDVGDWQRVRQLAGVLRIAEEQRGETAAVVGVAERVYGADTGIGREALAAYTISPLSTAEIRRLQIRTTAQLVQLAAGDPDWSVFYTGRRATLEKLPVETRPDPAGGAEETLREEAREALRAGRWDSLESLAEALGGARVRRGDECGCGSLPKAPRPPEPGPAATETAIRYGLHEVRLEARDDLRTFVACRCVLAPHLSEEALAEDGARRESVPCGCHHRCPELGERLRDTLDLLKHRGFLTSLGTRYLPTFAYEVVLLETFPETAAERGPLLEPLGLPRRLGLSRLEIEEALALRGADVLDELRLDPLVYVIAPVPFDVYVRAATQFGWTQRPRWTHLDGYQVLQGWRLRALVGGNARYGGPADLCSIGRDDARDDVLVRFCVLSRRRFADSIAGGTGAP